MFGSMLDEKVIEASKDIIDEHLHEPITVARLAETLSLRREQLACIFKRSTGLSTYQFILKRRLQKTLELLATTQESLADIAYDVGFSSQSHMTSTFQRLLGTTPQRYRNQRLL